MKKSAESLPKILEMAAATGSLHAQRVRCGKSNCKCARGEPHVAYYFFWSTPGGVRKHYVRRADVPAVCAAVEQRRCRRAAFRNLVRRAETVLREMRASMKVRT
ncbi:MAG: DUF6788 family protein [Pyrinomonadaceae bacterium]